MVVQELTVLQELVEHLVQVELQVPQELVVLRVYQVLMELQVHLVQVVLQV